MLRLDAWASEPQYLAHLAPVWLALREELRGTLYGLQGVEEGLGPGLPLPGLKLGPERPSGPNPVLVASWGDHAGVAPARTVFLEHGCGQAYTDAENPCYSGGTGRDRACLFLVPSRHVAERNRARYPRIPNAIVGCPKLDCYHPARGVGESGRPRGPHKPENAGSNPATATSPVVAVSFHWNDAQGPPERRSAFAHYEPALAALAEAFPGAIGHAHPRWYNQLAWPLERAGLEPVRSFAEVVERADLYACDNSSTLYEFAALDRPVVVLNAPWYRRDLDLWPRFWDCADVGVQVDEPDHLVERVGEALADTPPMRRNRLRAVRTVYAHLDGRASQRAAEAIALRLARLDEEDPVPDPYGPVSAPPPNRAQLDAPGHPDIPRMRACGASEAECAEADRLWQSMSEQDRWGTTDAMNSWTDEELRQKVIEGRTAPIIESDDPPEGTVAEVRAWIGGDPERARAALDAERRRERVRSGVTDHVAEVLGT